jgi:hypothetical protein
VRGEMDQTWRRYESMWTRIIAEGQTAGAFAYCGDPKMIAFAILGMCNWLARWYDPRKSVSVDELIETYFEMLAHGLVRQEDRRQKDKGLFPAQRSELPNSRPKRIAASRRARASTR